MSETTQRIFLHSRQGQFSLPDFPGADTDAWLDKHRSFPRLPITPQNRIDQSERLPQTSRLRSPVVFTVPTDHVKPIAISVYCQSGCLRRRRPFLGFENHVPFHPRYYPLRSTVRLGIEPRAEQWSPESLVGLWLGSHGPHGTECLYVEWDEIQSTLRGWKITGDENVPRGALSWDVSTARLYQVSSTQSDLFARSFGTSPIARLYEGTGTVSARGFMPHQQNHLSLVMGVDEPDVFRILWVEVEEVSMYIRYKGEIAAGR
ncbi:hypothetical protein A0H81_10921 [Grifola frondosa]|uniref:Uncharacterized protein n=1 Tax=Grifola frondosa TaxID=5627 RepID=A0A1C7M2I4_GRIFR|nr:hypothetical protein A0H81_10921 [Grifola frondosa]